MRLSEISRLRKATISIGWYFFLLGASIGKVSPLRMNMACKAFEIILQVKLTFSLLFRLPFIPGNWSSLVPTILISHHINDAILGAILVSAILGKSSLCRVIHGSVICTIPLEH